MNIASSNGKPCRGTVNDTDDCGVGVFTSSGLSAGFSHLSSRRSALRVYDLAYDFCYDFYSLYWEVGARPEPQMVQVPLRPVPDGRTPEVVDGGCFFLNISASLSLSRGTVPRPCVGVAGNPDRGTWRLEIGEDAPGDREAKGEDHESRGAGGRGFEIWSQS